MLLRAQVGNAGDVGIAEISDLVITTTGGSAGAIGIEWNLEATSAGAAGLWDVHVRLGGAMVRSLLSFLLQFVLMGACSFVGHQHQCGELPYVVHQCSKVRVGVPGYSYHLDWHWLLRGMLTAFICSRYSF